MVPQGSDPKNAIMLVGFGGPEKPDQVRPFLNSVLKGVSIPQARFDEVLRHYEVIGGISPYNTIIYRQREALEKELLKRGIHVPVRVGFRHSSPSLVEALKDLKAAGTKKVVGFILASLRSYASFEKYKERVVEAQKETGTEEIRFVYTRSFHKEPFFIEAQADQALKVIRKIDPQDLNKTFFLFSAHSIPVPMAEASGYDRQFEKIAELIAKKLDLKHWAVAYQSRSGNPRDPWLEPSVEAVVKSLDRRLFKNVVLVSAGFLCDNVEVVYDLDHECRDLCKSLGLGYFRAQTVTDHPQFIRLVADLVTLSLRGTQ